MDIIPPKTPGIYKITCNTTGKIYIGSAQNLRKRWNEHRAALRASRHANQYLQRAWASYGESAFQFEILELVMFVENLIEREQHYLDTLRPYDRNIGFNMTIMAGSTQGRFHNEQTRKKISEKARQRPPVDENYRQKLSSALQGREFTDEHRQKLSDALRKRIRSPETYKKIAEARRKNGTNKHNAETRQRISAAGIGRVVSDETRAKRAALQTGRSVSQEARKKISEANRNPSQEKRQRMSQSQRNRDRSTFYDIAEAMAQRPRVPKHVVTHIATGHEMIVHLRSFCTEHGLTYPTMIKIAAGKLKSHKGYTVRKL